MSKCDWCKTKPAVAYREAGNEWLCEECSAVASLMALGMGCAVAVLVAAMFVVVSFLYEATR